MRGALLVVGVAGLIWASGWVEAGAVLCIVCAATIEN